MGRLVRITKKDEDERKTQKKVKWECGYAVVMPDGKKVVRAVDKRVGGT